MFCSVKRSTPRICAASWADWDTFPQSPTSSGYRGQSQEQATRQSWCNGAILCPPRPMLLGTKRYKLGKLTNLPKRSDAKRLGLLLEPFGSKQFCQAMIAALLWLWLPHISPQKGEVSHERPVKTVQRFCDSTVHNASEAISVAAFSLGLRDALPVGCLCCCSYCVQQGWWRRIIM